MVRGSAINLVLLGLLLERPMSAYEVTRWAEHCQLQEMVKISTPAIYKNLLKLAKSEFLAAEVVKEGEMPEKTVYSVTDAGRSHFNELIELYAQEAVKLHFDFNAVILNLDKVPREKALAMLDSLEAQFVAKRAFLGTQLEAFQYIPLTGRTVIKQLHMVNEALIAWLNEFRQEYEVERQ